MLHFLLQCYGMKPTETVSTGQLQTAPSTSRRYSYHKVSDGRNHPIRGLWLRNGKYYARLTAPDPVTGQKAIRWVHLENSATVAEAKAALRGLLVNRDKNELPPLKRSPKFSEYVEKYLAYFNQVTDAKRPRTLATERVHLRRLVAFLGDTRLDKITLPRIRDYIAQRQMGGWTARTVNLGITVLRNVLNRAIDDGWLQRLPTENLRPLKSTPKKRELITMEEINRLCAGAMVASKNGPEFSDYVRLLAYCGARRNEALRLRWTDVDWTNQQLTIGADGLTKNRKARVVDFNDKLEAHLKEMLARRAPDSQWLFPSPQRGDKDISAKTFVETLRLARKAAGLPGIGFHDLRHHFISFAVMSGIDFMTIARWVGHQDGGILIGKVYGHLASEHTKAQARRLVFEPRVIESSQPKSASA